VRLPPSAHRLTHALRRHAAWARRRPMVAASLWVAVVGAVAMVGLDRPLALWLKAQVQGEWKGFWSVVTDVGTALYWYMVGLVAWGWSRARSVCALTGATWARWRDIARAWLAFLLALAATGLVVTVLKHLIGRLRPVKLFREEAYGFDPLAFEAAAASFPSGHSQTIWAVMTMLMVMFPRHWPTWVGIGVLVASSRLFVTVHYLSDVLVGSLIGIVGALLVARWAVRRGWSLRIGKPL